MQEFSIYHIDAFTTRIFSGNPAAVCLLTEWLPQSLLHAIAKENCLPVTAFLVRENGQYSLRWMTPEHELDLCGHGTLAAGYVLFHFLEPTCQKAIFRSPTVLLPVLRQGDLITLDFSTQSIEPFAHPILEQALGAKPKEVYQQKNERCLAVFETEEEVRKLNPNKEMLKQIGHRGFVITAPGQSVDFVSRTFYPQKTLFEDPVTGVSHTLLAPYWAKRLNKDRLHCWQVSERMGELICECKGERVLISGKAALYLQGKASFP